MRLARAPGGMDFTVWDLGFWGFGFSLNAAGGSVPDPESRLDIGFGGFEVFSQFSHECLGFGAFWRPYILYTIYLQILSTQ